MIFLNNEPMCVNERYDYKDKHLKLKIQMHKLDSDHSNLMGILEAFNGKTHEPINYNDLLKFPLFEWVDLNCKVAIRRRNMLFKEYINFDTEIKKGGEFGKHFHSDVIESAEIIEGKVLDKNDGEVYEEGDVMHYEKNQHHTPIALIDSKLKVIFKP